MEISGFANLGMDDDFVLFQPWPSEIPQQWHFEDGENKAFKKMRSNPSFRLQDHHVVAERKRRQKLSQRFAALSALLPGLKKTDKASILEEAIKYTKQLEAKEKSLHEKKMMRAMKCEGVVLPVIEARCYNSELLISIHYDTRRRRRRKGMLARIVAEIEKLHFSVANCSLMPFGDSALNLTIISQMEEGHKHNSMSMEEVVKILRASCCQYIM